jgi:hypothetical protein
LLTTLADDDDEKVKSAVIKAFAQLSREELISELKSMGVAGNASMKLSVLSFLAHLSWPELISLIVNLAADEDPEVRKKAVRILAEKGEPLFLELIAAWIPAAGVEDLGMLLEQLPVFDKVTKGERSTDVQILKSRLQRIIDGDDAARNIDVVLSVLKAPDNSTVDSTGSAGAADKYRTQKVSNDLKLKKAKKVEQDNELRQGRLGEQNILQQLHFITKIVYFLKIAAVFSLFYLGWHHLNPLWDQYIQHAEELRIASDFKTMASAITRSEAGGKKFAGDSSDDLVTQGLLQSCSDPWAQPYLISTFYKSFKSLGADRSQPVTAPFLLTEQGQLLKSDDITDYYGLKKPPLIWISVATPGKPGLFGVSVDGSEARDITGISSNAMHKPSMSPDGLRLAWLQEVSSDSGRNIVYKLCLGDNLGKGAMDISDGGTEFSAICWSQDSSRLIYSYNKVGGSGLSKMVVYNNTSGESKTYFSDMPDNDTNPSFSRSDGTIYFARRLGSDAPVLKCYRDDWVATKEPFDRTIYGDMPIVSADGSLIFFKENGSSQRLYRILNGHSDEELYHGDLGILPPVRISSNAKTIVFPARSDYGWVVKVFQIKTDKKGQATSEVHPVFGTPFPVLSITEQKSGSFSESSENGEEFGNDGSSDGGPHDSGEDSDTGHREPVRKTFGRGTTDGDIDI